MTKYKKIFQNSLDIIKNMRAVQLKQRYLPKELIDMILEVGLDSLDDFVSVKTITYKNNIDTTYTKIRFEDFLLRKTDNEKNRKKRGLPKATHNYEFKIDLYKD